MHLLRLLVFGWLHLIIRGQDITRTTKTTREAGRRCRPGRSGGSACASGYLGEDVVAQVAQHSAGVGQLGAAQVDLVVRHHPDELKDLLPAGDKARAQHVVHAEGLGGRGGRRSRVVRGIRELLAQLQVVQDEPVAVVGYAQAVRGLAVGAVAKLELIQAANRAPVYAPSGNNAQFSVPSAASTQ